MTRLLRKAIMEFQALEFDSVHWCHVNFYGLGYERIIGLQWRWRGGWAQNATGSGKTLHMGPLFAYQWR